jgi:phosphatidylserine/phosphatidylglycerophosphate/cardiolipin synthase-like enzyme
MWADLSAATGEYVGSYQALADAGITVITDTAPSKSHHIKFLVIDGHVLWTGSTNLTDTGLMLNANNSLSKRSKIVRLNLSLPLRLFWRPRA